MATTVEKAVTVEKAKEITLEELKARIFDLHTMFGSTRLTRIWTDLLKAAYGAQDFAVGLNATALPAFARDVFDERRLLRPHWTHYAKCVDKLMAAGDFFTDDYMPRELYDLYSAVHHMAGAFDEDLLEEVECEGVEGEDDQ